jgi:hypothetical protein
MSTESIRIGPCNVIYDGQHLGLTIGGVEVEVTTSTHVTMVDQLGETIVDEFVMGRNITVKVPLAETTIENLVKLMPGATLLTDGARATGTITVSAVPGNLEYIFINGVKFTFTTVVDNPHEVLRTGVMTTAELAQSLLDSINDSIDDRITRASYSLTGSVITITYDRYGVEGNAFTLGAGTAAADIVMSGATLTGGVVANKQRVDVVLNAGYSLLESAKVLILHPTRLPATDRSEDLIVWRANAPGELQFAYKFDTERVFMANFKGFPDPNNGYRLFSVGNINAI